ncbi:MAG: terminase family protein [Desulfovibrio sp.]|jgi:hypothetical protein|nr:terminase family protein [Desulfovibrio sp.]
MRLKLHKRQSEAFISPATEILYGGAAGGGKSHLLRVACIAYCQEIPGFQAYLFRRESPDLIQNHMVGQTGFPSILADYVNRGLVKINLSRMEIHFQNGSIIHLRHCQYEKDVYGYQGAEINALCIDELTSFTETIYVYLRGRCRLGGLEIPPAYVGLFPRIICGSNPGGVGHTWVKASFVDGCAPMEIRHMPPEEGGMLRQYIPAKLADNPTLMLNDPQYEAKLSGLGSPELVRAMREGDWDIVAGGMLDDVWRRDIHILPPFSVPADWHVDRSMDWGSSRPFSVIWWAESDGSPARMADGTERHFPPGTLFAVAEWYGCAGKPDQGLRLTAREIAEGVKERERAMTARGGILAGHSVAPGPADNSIFTEEGAEGKSVGGIMRACGVLWAESDKRPGSRVAGWEQIRQRLRAAMQSPPEYPGLFVFRTCADWIRTVPVLPRDMKKPDDVDTRAEDHAGDATRYRVLDRSLVRGRDLR